MVVSVDPLQVDLQQHRVGGCAERVDGGRGSCTLPAGHSGYHSAPLLLQHVNRARIRYTYRWLDAGQEATVAAARAATRAA
jgi:hypothetical protein